jgi:AraC family transcriptional regulator
MNAFDTSVSGRLAHGQNFGAMTHAVASGDLYINAADHAPGTEVPPHEHANAYLCVVVAGAFELRARRVQDCAAGSVIACPANHTHANRFADQPGRCVNIHFGPTWTGERLVREWLDDYRHVALGAAAPSLRRLAREMSAADSAAPLAVASAAIELVAKAMRAEASRGPPRWLARIIDIVEADLPGAPGLGRLAAEIGAHPAHLARAFRRAYGETIGEYVRRRRVEEAEHALANAELSLADIAIAAGFSDQAHFTRVFRRHFGVSPGARRRAMQVSS